MNKPPAVSLAACGSGPTRTLPGPMPVHSVVVPTSTPTNSGPSVGASSASLPQTSGPVASPSVKASPPVKASPTTGRCLVSQLTVTEGSGNGAAMHYLQNFVLHNRSSTSCTLNGHPGIVFVDGQGRDIQTHLSRGAAIGLGGSGYRRVLLAPGQEASFQLQGLDYDSAADKSCPNAAGIKVIPPDDYVQVLVPAVLPVCRDNQVLVSAVAFGNGSA